MNKNLLIKTANNSPASQRMRTGLAAQSCRAARDRQGRASHLRVARDRRASHPRVARDRQDRRATLVLHETDKSASHPRVARDRRASHPRVARDRQDARATLVLHETDKTREPQSQRSNSHCPADKFTRRGDLPSHCSSHVCGVVERFCPIGFSSLPLCYHTVTDGGSAGATQGRGTGGEMGV